MSALDDILARLHFEDNRVIERCVARSCVIDNDDAEAAAQELFDLRTRIAELEKAIEHVIRADELNQDWDAQRLVDLLPKPPEEK